MSGEVLSPVWPNVLPRTSVVVLLAVHAGSASPRPRGGGGVEALVTAGGSLFFTPSCTQRVQEKKLGDVQILHVQQLLSVLVPGAPMNVVSAGGRGGVW